APLLLFHIGWIELILAERTLAAHGLERRIDDELSQGRVTADVPLPENVQFLRRYFAEYIAEVEVGIRDAFHIAPADLAQITLLAQRHDASLGKAGRTCQVANSFRGGPASGAASAPR